MALYIYHCNLNFDFTVLRFHIYGRTTNVRVLTSQPSNLLFQNDTLKNFTTGRVFSVERDNKPLIITAFSDSAKKTVSVKPKNSFAYWLNIYPYSLFVGFYIDTKTKKRYTYPRSIYIDFAVKDSSYLDYKPLDVAYEKYINVFKITPLKIIGITNPSIELSYERKTGRSFSSQITASYLLPISLMDISNNISPNTVGFKVGIEERFYFRKSAPVGTYIATEANYLNNRYTSTSSFRSRGANGLNTYPDIFDVAKQTFSFNLKIGHQIINKRLSWDFYAGLGLRHKNVKHLNRSSPNDVIEASTPFNIYYLTNLDGKYWRISLPLNMKVGWTF